MSLRLHNLTNRPGSKHRVKRLGCGESSGHGKTSGRGGKGQTARTGSGIRPGFEGGQMPLIRRIPKRGFNNADFCTEYEVVNVEQLNDFDEGATVTPERLKEKGVIRSRLDGVKILGGGEIKRKLTIKAHAFSASAKEKISNAGGQCELIARVARHIAPSAPKEAKSAAAAEQVKPQP